MPTLKSLKNLCDKMKNLSPTTIVLFTLNGDLTFVVETDSAMVSSRYFNLLVNKSANPKAQIDADEICCRVDSKQLSLCFTSVQVIYILFVIKEKHKHHLEKQINYKFISVSTNLDERQHHSR